MFASRKIVTLAFSVPFVVATAGTFAQKQITPADGRIVRQTSQAEDNTAQEEPEVKAVVPSVDSAWGMLTTAAHKTTQTRIVAMAAFGTMGTDRQTAKMLAEGMKDPELDVRLAAVLAAGQTKNRELIPALRERLKDPEPQVVFIAAATLWKMKDRAGEPELRAVVGGERRATPGLVHGAKNDVNHELHDPAALATLGATEGASMLLGPFGFGVTAFEYMRKSGSNPARAEAINLLAESRGIGVRDEFLAALHDKDASVRAAAARALGQWHDPEAVKPIGELFNDSKLPVRLTAAAAYINCSRAHGHGGV